MSNELLDDIWRMLGNHHQFNPDGPRDVYNTSESINAYHRTVAEWIESDRTPLVVPAAEDEITVVELAAHFWGGKNAARILYGIGFLGVHLTSRNQS